MKRAWIVAVCTVLAVLMAVSTAAADSFDPHSPGELRDNGWNEYNVGIDSILGFDVGEETSIFCKTKTEVTEDDN
ncbi:hypothetical protein NI17_009635 [Thermobifida halotolerans]|uniref:Uncharacterized protein n=2 Tax=Thermobifida halotolerans TaxID=483545 RepID=A0AA97M5R7_9ACTN|nr:hypothetical protein [Thermobifida halotolerans]UOE21355.1 hypothetical protein NI17_009635 [Thermobifida halotolerans]